MSDDAKPAALDVDGMRRDAEAACNCSLPPTDREEIALARCPEYVLALLDALAARDAELAAVKQGWVRDLHREVEADGGPPDWFLYLLSYAFGLAMERDGARNGMVLDTMECPDESGKTYGPYSVSVTRKEGKSPTETITELRAELAEARAALKREANGSGCGNW